MDTQGLRKTISNMSVKMLCI